jgi:hypothetical protein
MEQRGRADHIRTGLQRDTPRGLSVLKVVDRGEVTIHQHGIGERPQVLGWLEFGRIGRQEE